MKIALVTHSYDKHQGVSRVVAELAERLARGHEVHVFTAYREGGDDTSITFHRVPVFFHRWSLVYPTFFLLSGRLLRQHQFDIIHLHSPSYYKAHLVTCHSVPQAGMEYLRRLPKAVTMAITPWRVLPDRLLRPLFVYNFRPGRQRRVIAISDRIREELIDCYRVAPQNILLIPNGVDLDTFHPGHRERFAAAVRAEYGFLPDTHLFLFVGNDFRRKGLQLILQALGLVRAEKVGLLVVGPPGDAPYFQRLVTALKLEHRVVFAGLQRDVARFYAAADCFVFPSLYEPFGLVLLEAMASGLPVITAWTVGGATALIEDGINGLLVDQPYHVEGLAEKMELVIRDEGLRRRLGRNARQVAEQYSWDRHVERTLQAYRDVLKQSA